MHWSTYGLPKGFVLALLLNCFVDVGSIFQLFGVLSHQFADDTRVLLHGSASSAIQISIIYYRLHLS